jgi:DNA-binding MarR family transcriptional regulator
MREKINLPIKNDPYAKMMENALGSRGRIRILRLLSRYPDHTFTQYRIAQSTGLKRQDIIAHLKTLEKTGLIEKRGKTAVRYCLNDKSVEAEALKNLFQKIRLA